MADTAKYKSLSVSITDWKDLGLIAEKTSRTRSKMINKLIKLYKENRGERTNGRFLNQNKNFGIIGSSLLLKFGSFAQLDSFFSV